MQHDNDAAEVFYTRAIEADPDNATNLGKFAYFLHAVRGDHHMAHLHYQKAVQCGDNNADILGNYANFLETERDDKELAETFYKQADGVVVCFSVTDTNSFENVKTWMESIE